MARKSNTRSAAGQGSIRQRPDGRWEGRFIVGYDHGTGKNIRRSVYGNTQKEVRQQMTAILTSIDNGTYNAPSRMTVGEWFDIWVDTFAAQKVKPLTLSAYKMTIKNHIKPALGALRLQAVKGMHIQQLYNALSARGLSPKTVKNTGAIMHKAFSIALKQGYIVSNPCDGAELPEVIRKEIKPLTDAEIQLFIKAIDNHPMRNAYALCLFAGLREGECLGLSWGNIDFTKQRIVINQQLQKSKESGTGYYIAHSTKSGRAREIQPPSIAFEYLKAERVKQLEDHLRAGENWNNPDDLVFTNEFGRHYAMHTFYKNFKKIVAGIGRPDARPHDLRHTAATVAIAAGSDIKSVQSLLGHATASFTLDIYAHTSEKMMQDTAARMGNYYNNIYKANA